MNYSDYYRPPTGRRRKKVEPNFQYLPHFNMQTPNMAGLYRPMQYGQEGRPTYRPQPGMQGNYQADGGPAMQYGQGYQGAYPNNSAGDRGIYPQYSSGQNATGYPGWSRLNSQSELQQNLARARGAQYRVSNGVRVPIYQSPWANF